MAQVKIYGLAHLRDRRETLSKEIHQSLQLALEIPPEKRFHRFFWLEKEDFFFPEDRSQDYLILEIHLFAGRSRQAKKRLIQELFERFEKKVGIHPQDLEITLIETASENWGIRGQPGNELKLNYNAKI